MFRSLRLSRNREKLANPDPRVRRAAAKALGKLKDPRALEPLIRALEDKEPTVREAAAHA